jgi:regulatory protein
MPRFSPPDAHPGTVSALIEHVRRRGRFVVEIDGIQAGVVGVETIADLGLSVGRAVDGAGLRALRRADRRFALLDRALNLLAVRARSARELCLRLARTGALKGDVTWVSDRLERSGYLDDAVFARQLAESRFARGVSRRRVSDELFRRGVAQSVAAAAIDSVAEEVEVDEYAAALAAAQKRIASLSSVDLFTRRRRLYAFLARRGYQADVVGRVVREVTGGRAAG